MASHFPHKEILVGGKHYYTVDTYEMCLACRLVGVAEPTEEGSTGGFSVRSIYISHHSHCGMLYRTGEFVFVKLNGIQQQHLVCMKITRLFSFKIHEVYHIFVSGIIYKSTGIHQSSGNPIVSETSSSRMVLAQDILRKVMLFPTDNEYVVIDYERTTLPLCPEDISVPQYPEQGDMVLVRGEGDETWLAHVHSSNEISKSCLVYFYIPVQENPKLYREERHKLEKVHWDCVLGYAQGQWQDETQYLLESVADN